MARQIPNVNAPIMEGGKPIDRNWHRWLRLLESDHDSLAASVASHLLAYASHVLDFNAHVDDFDVLDAAFASHIANLYGHGWTPLTDKAIGVGETSIAHGLGSTPTQVIMVKDVAPPVWVDTYQTAAQSINSASLTTVHFDTEKYDIGSNFNTATYTFTAPHAGLYTVSAMVGYQGLADGNYHYTRISCSTYGRKNLGYGSAGAAGYLGFSSSHDVQLVAGETVHVETYQSAGAARSLVVGANENSFSVRSIQDVREGTHDATNIKIWSARTRTMSFLVR